VLVEVCVRTSKKKEDALVNGSKDEACLNEEMLTQGVVYNALAFKTKLLLEISHFSSHNTTYTINLTTE
jgi:hypothetical protein